MDPEEIVRRCEKLSLFEADGPKAKIDGDLHEKELDSVSRSLVGRIIAIKEINRDAFKAMIPKVWRTTKEVDIELVGSNTFMFRFRCMWDRKRVLEGAVVIR
ncbi:hypothetical protein ACOSQ4_033222 [Xanthoceras sorbifolium]